MIVSVRSIYCLRHNANVVLAFQFDGAQDKTGLTGNGRSNRVYRVYRVY